MFELQDFAKYDIIILGDSMSSTKYNLKCEFCKKDFISLGNKKQRFCSQKCSIDFKINSKRKIIDNVQYKKCDKCNEFLINNKDNFQIKSKTFDGLSHTCKKCESIINKDKYKNNLSYRERYLNVDKNKKSEYRKLYYIKNREKELQRAILYNEVNREKIRTREIEYRKTEKGRQVNILKGNKRRARIKSLEHKISIKEWNNCKDYFRDENKNLRCAYCNKIIKKATLEHFIPISKSGATIIKNILPICLHCNCSKQDKDFIEWYSKQDFYNEQNILKINEYFKSL